MPIYEYRCEDCAKVSEFSLKFSDPQPQVCPACSKGPLKKLISQTSFVLKGGGWYADAYSSKAQPKASDKADSDVSTAKPEGDTKTAASEPKPAAQDAKPTPAPAKTPAAASD